MQKPFNINLRGTTIDGNEEHEIRWQVTGSIQINYQIKIYDNSDDSLTYDSTKLSSYSLKHVLPSGSLLNGKEYKIQIQIWNNTGGTALSDFEIFQTSSRPVVTVEEINTITAPSYFFTATYYQNENIPIRYFYVYIYDMQRMIKNSGMINSSILEFFVDGLQSEKQYYVEFRATSEKGLVGTSGLINFNVLYTQPQINVQLNAENYDKASIKLNWKVIQIIGNSEPDPPVYINNQKIDLLNGRVWFDEGFSINKNFTIKLWLENPKNKEDLLVLKGSNGEFTLQYWKLDNRFRLFKRIESNQFVTSYISEIVNSGSYFVYIQQIGDLCNLNAEDY